MDRNNVNINSVSQGTRVLSLKDCRKIAKFSSDVFRLYCVYEINYIGLCTETNKQTKKAYGWQKCLSISTLCLADFSYLTYFRLVDAFKV